MYDLPHFKANSNDEVLAFMRAHPFVTLCGADKEGYPVATQVPVLFLERERKLLLRAHIQRKTDHHKAFSENPKVLAIFTGSHSYVSASWYQDQKVAGTWNYQAVHASGIIKFGDDDMLYNLLGDLTAHHENNPHSPSLVKELPPDYVAQHMKAIIAFEIEVTGIRHVFKLSQNRDEISRENIIHRLETSSDADAKNVALEMKTYYASAGTTSENSK
jgi:transcriptional regulator